MIIATYHTGDKGPLSTIVRLILLEIILLGSGLPMAFLGRAVLPVALVLLGLAVLVGLAFWRVWKLFMPDVVIRLELTDAELRWRTATGTESRPLSQVKWIEHSEKTPSRGKPQEMVTIMFSGLNVLTVWCKRPGISAFIATVQETAPHVTIK